MNFSIRETTRRLLAPRHEVSCSRRLWTRLLRQLRDRGRLERESGAFLLGTRDGNGVRIEDFVLYDDIDPHGLDTGIVRLDGRHFGRLWEICRERNLAAVADVHTHPGSSGQSPSDRAHPIIACAGHIALIVPHFARPPVRREDVGMYRYRGAGEWEVIPSKGHRSFFHIGV